MSLVVACEFEPALVSDTDWDELAADLGLSRTAWASRRRALAQRIHPHASALRDEARRDGWHDPILDGVLTVIETRAGRVAAP